MHTNFHIRQPYADIFLKCADTYQIETPAIPERFIQKMKNNTGMAGGMFGITDEAGLEFRNPLIVALGDSVTAGHFESLMTPDLLSGFGVLFGALQEGLSPEEALAKAGMTQMPPVEIFDARESYIEKFRQKLIDKYETTSVSVLNSGIAGDTLPSMAARAERDVIRYDPDLILVNGTLNWNDAEMGDASVFKKILKELVERFKNETSADIILLTPNGDLPNTMFAAPGTDVPEPTTAARCEAVREVAYEENVCLADVRKVWDLAKEAGCPWEELLANKINHPAVEGHEVYARVLMKLFQK